MAEASEIDIIITAIDNASQQISGVDQNLGKLSSTSKETGGSMGGLSGMVTAAIPGFGEIAGAVAIGMAALDVAKGVVGTFTDAISDMSSFIQGSLSGLSDFAYQVQQITSLTGMAAEDASGFASVMDDFGMSASQSAMSLTTFSKELANTADGSTKGGTAIDKLKVSVKNADGTMRETNDVMMDTMDALSKLPAGYARTDLAQQIFGRGTKFMLPMLEDGAAGFKKMKQENEALNVTLTEGEKSTMLKYRASMINIGNAMTGVKNTIALALAPALEKLAAKFVEWAARPEVQQMLTDLGAKLGEVANKVGEFIIKAVEWVSKVAIPWVKEHWPQIKIVMTGVLVVVGLVTAAIVLLAVNIALLVAGGTVLSAMLYAIIGLLVGLFTTAFKEAKLRVQELSDKFAQLPGEISSYMSNVAESIMSPFRTAFSWVEGQVDKLKSTLSSLGSKIKSALGMRQSGGNVGANQSYIVGEYGPELFTPTTTGQIISNRNLRGMGMGGGGVTINFYGNINNEKGYTPEQVGQAINRQLVLVKQGAF